MNMHQRSYSGHCTTLVRIVKDKTVTLFTAYIPNIPVSSLQFYGQQGTPPAPCYLLPILIFAPIQPAFSLKAPQSRG